MAHDLQAIVGAPSVVAHARSLGLPHDPIALEEGLAWVPVFDHDLDRLGASSSLATSGRDARFVYLGGVLPAILSALSEHGPVAYIETAYFGGVGRQAGTAVHRGEVILAHGSVNDALRAIGVNARDGLDEWDTVGLGNHRSMPWPATADFDAYDDGIAIELTLPGPATDEDLGIADELLDEWLSRYESTDGVRYRNSGVRGSPGSTTLVLWADRIDDPGGGDCAIAHADEIAARARARLSLASVRVTDANAASNGDLEQRLGAPVIVVRPGDSEARRPRVRWMVAIVALLLTIGGCLYLRWLAVTPYAVRDLPDEASHVEYHDIDMFPDWQLYVQAELEEEHCRRHVADEYGDHLPLDLDAIPEHERGWINWGLGPHDEHGNGLAWWSPPELSPTDTWVHGQPGSWSIVQCADGHFFLYAFTH